MRLLKFPYSTYQDKKGPIIPLMILGQSGWKVFWAYVDSGASYSIFSSEDAGRLGLNLERGERIFMVVGNGAQIPVYLFRLPLKIEEMTIEAVIGFSPKLGIDFNLLGRKDVFENFKICFDDQEGLLTFVRR